MSQTRLVLVRHGESVAQVEGFFAGHDACRGLSDRGRAQVATLRDRWAETQELGPVAALYTSLMRRAVETAEILAPAIGDPEIRQACDLCEIHPGEADGLTWEMIRERWPSDGGDWPGTLIPGAETWAGMSPRIEKVLETLAQRHEGETVVIACHGGVIAHSMFAHLGLAPTNVTEKAWFTADNASVTEWVLDLELDDWRKGRWGLVRYNDHAHTQAAGLPSIDH